MSLHPVAEDAVGRLVADYDRVLPGRLEGLYVVGSSALGAWRPLRSDIDFVGVIGGETGDTEIAAMGRLHRREQVRGIRRAVRRRGQPLVCNGVFVRWADLARSPLEVAPIAGQVAQHFGPGRARAFDVNPVTWRTLARGGIAVRGPDAAALGIASDDAELRAWTCDNLERYWRQWARDIRQGGSTPWGAAMMRTAYIASWGVLGAPRLHCTIATGEIVSKEAAGEYALDTFDARWHGLIVDALASWRGTSTALRPVPREQCLAAADFVDMVVDHGLAGASESGRAHEADEGQQHHRPHEDDQRHLDG